MKTGLNISFLWMFFFMVLTVCGETSSVLTLPVGRAEVPWNKCPDFDVVCDEEKGIIHFVYSSNYFLYYMNSLDEGTSWSQPEALGAGRAQRLALDSSGNLHMAYGIGRHKSLADTICYRSRSVAGHWDSVWTMPYPRGTLRIAVPRIVVDGNDNVHIIGWKFGFPQGGDDWKKYTRLVYTCKNAKTGVFENVLELRHNVDQPGSGAGGADELAVDPQGNVHIIYRSWEFRPEKKNGFNHRMTHLVRNKDGAWIDSARIYDFFMVDFALDTKFDTSGTLHVAGVFFDKNDRKNKVVRWGYWKKQEDSTQLQLVKIIDVDWDPWTRLMLTPQNDIWMTFANKNKDGRLAPLRGVYLFYNKKTDKWTDPISLSPETGDFHNVDNRHGQTPKPVYFKGRPRIFFAENQGRGNFKFYQRIF